MKGNFSPNQEPFEQCRECERNLCKTCKERIAQRCGVGKNGNVYYRPECKICVNERVGRIDTRTPRERNPWKVLSLKIRLEVGKCERCGFIPEHIGQLDVDHKDADNKNNERSNLMVLCSNCHRLKSILNKDWVKAKLATIGDD